MRWRRIHIEAAPFSLLIGMSVYCAAVALLVTLGTQGLHKICIVLSPLLLSAWQQIKKRMELEFEKDVCVCIGVRKSTVSYLWWHYHWIGWRWSAYILSHWSIFFCPCSQLVGRRSNVVGKQCWSDTHACMSNILVYRFYVSSKIRIVFVSFVSVSSTTDRYSL